MGECERCEELKALLIQAETANAELGDMLAGRELQLRKAGAAEVALRRRLENERKEDDDWPTVRAVLEHWRTKTGHSRAVIDPAGDRAAVVRKALKSLTRGSEEQRLETVLLAIDGLALKPYVGPQGRSAVGSVKQRYDDVRHALGDEERIEKFAEQARAAQRLAVDEAKADPGPMWFWYERVLATARAWGGLVVDAVVEREQEQLRQIEADRGYVRPDGLVQAPKDALTGDMEEAA